MNWRSKVAFNELRAVVNAAVVESQGQQYSCAECQGRLFLVCGRHSSKWFFTHEGITECRQRAIFFTTKAEAEQAEEIWE